MRPTRLVHYQRGLNTKPDRLYSLRASLFLDLCALTGDGIFSSTMRTICGIVVLSCFMASSAFVVPVSRQQASVRCFAEPAKKINAKVDLESPKV